jgi:GxxExxY protein
MNTDLKAKADERREKVGQGGKTFHGLHAEITEKVIGVFFEVYNELGGGFLESVYQQALRIALVEVGPRVAAEVPVPVYFRGEVVGNFRADVIVNESVLLELKAVSSFDSAHDGQVLHYLRATRFEVGLLLNFGPKPQFRRFILEQENKKIRILPRESAVEVLRDC